MKITREILLGLLLVSYILAFSSILFEATPLVSTLIKISILIILILIPKTPPIKGSVIYLISLFSVLLLYGLILAPLSNSFSNSIFFIIKLSIQLLFFIFLLQVLQTNNYKIISVLKTISIVGFVLAVLSLLLFTLIYFDIAPQPKIIDNPTRGLLTSYGILGYADAVQSPPGGHDVLRLQSFYSEPSVFGKFLEFCVIILFGLYQLTKRRKYLIMTIVTALALVLTLSYTSYLAIFLAISLYAIIKNGGKHLPLKIGLLIIIVLFLLGANSYLKNNYNPDSQSRTAIEHLLLSRYGNTNKISTIAYGGRVHSHIEAFKLFLDYPFGLGILENSQIPELNRTGSEAFTSIHLAGAHLKWIVKTGIVGIVIYFLIFLLSLSKLIQITKQEKNIIQYVGIAFIAVTIHEIGTGNWFDPLYFIILAFMFYTSNKKNKLSL